MQITDNPRLHRLRTHWAVDHLMVIKTAMKKLYAFSNTNTLPAAEALRLELVRLTSTYPCYRDAAALLYARDVEGLEKLHRED